MSDARSCTRLAIASPLIVAVWLSACGGSDSTSPPTPTPPAPPAPTVQSISVTPASATLTALGATTALAAQVTLSNGNLSTNPTLTWSSSAPAVASVSGTTVTAVGNGSATITATSGSVQGTALITVQQAVASVRLLPADTVVKSAFQLRGAALDARGNAVTNAAVQYTAVSPTVSTTSQSGALTPLSTGVARFRLESGTNTATAIVRTIWNVQQVSDLFPLYEFSATNSARRVFSDVSQAHADARLAIVNDVWAALSTQWLNNGSPNTDMYFTASRLIWAEAVPFCGGQDLPNQTAWTLCQATGRQHFLVPEGASTTNDYFNIARFLTRQFISASYFGGAQSPWLVEGISAINAGGRVQGTTFVPGINPVIRADFRRGDSTNVLAPLDSLMRLNGTDYYRDLAIRAPVAIRSAQAAVFFAYLNQEFPTVIPAIQARIRSTPGAAVSNEDIIALILGQTGRTFPQLQTAYIAFGRTIP